MALSNGKVILQRKLNAFDVTNLVIGSIIGADVYVATGLSAQLVGPSSLLIWILAGVMAMVIAISFAYCVMLKPKVGGPYAYAKEVSTPFAGFMVGWALLLAEWFSLAVFPVAFAAYFVSLVPGIDAFGIVLLKAFFIAFVIVTNVISVKAAGRTNDVLTIVKMLPLALIIGGGIGFFFYNPGVLSANMTPFVTGDASAFGTALILVFWAYAGFELATLPANDVENPEHTIPKAIVFGMLVVIAFYLLTNFVVVGSVGQAGLMNTSTPLLTATSTIFSGPTISVIMVAVVGIGALFSILGADESGTIGTSRLAYAMALDGLLPRSFAKLHKDHGTPYVALIAICVSAFFVSVFGTLTALIDSSVFLLAFVYLATCLSAIRLEKKNPEAAKGLHLKVLIPGLGAGFSFMLLVLVDPVEIVISLILLAAGILVYAYFSPKKELAEAKEAFLSEESMLRRVARERTAFLAHPIFHLKRWIYKQRKIPPAIIVTSPEDPNKEQLI
ncbi:MAG TPA: APC family permease [Methanomassiliicoccales archaeon]|nr:APC family permease [Methanomassiliicoccales archaeon]